MAILNEIEAEDDGYVYLGKIPGIPPITEIMNRLNPNLLALATHGFIGDKELTASSKLQSMEDYEEFYRPYTMGGVSPEDGGHCGRWDCPLCKPVRYL